MTLNEQFLTEKRIARKQLLEADRGMIYLKCILSMRKKKVLNVKGGIEEWRIINVSLRPNFELFCKP
jgi:hypothetical protein